MENTEIIQKARAKAEMWLNDAYDKATRTEVERLLNASDPTAPKKQIKSLEE